MDKVYSYKSPETLSKITIILMALIILSSFVGILLGFTERNLLQNIENISENDANIHDGMQMVVGIVQGVFFYLGIIFFLIWLNRYSKNTHSVNSRMMEYTPGWTVGYFFIPIFNFFRPYQAVAELYTINRVGEGKSLVRWWWGVWLLSRVIGKVSFKLSMRAETLEQLQKANVATIFSDSLEIVCWAIMILLVLKMTKAQIAEGSYREEQEELSI